MPPLSDPPTEIRQADATERLAAEVAALRQAIEWMSAVLDDWRELMVDRYGQDRRSRRRAR